jgi:hypothetical protein
MPISIPSRHINRIFPYGFYKELFEHFDEYIPNLDTFIVKLAIPDLPNEKERYLDEISHKNTKQLLKEMREIVYIGLDFPVYFLMPYTSKESIIESEPNNSWLFVQYFYKTIPLFTPEQSLEVLREFPEILWDDPNLLIGIYDSSKDPTQAVLILKAPHEVLEQLHANGELYDD